jgi:hypothetical protein
MKVIIAGSRGITDYGILCKAIKESQFDEDQGITSIISGLAKGPDSLGRLYGKYFNIPVIDMPANWDSDGKAAGFIRNQAMANLCDHEDALIAIWGGVSKGTSDMVNRAKKRNMKIFIYQMEILNE